MTTSTELARLHRRLHALMEEGVGDDNDHRTLDALSDQLRQDRFRVLVTGEAKRGKSTLLNALLGREVLPTGVVPVTALATTVREGRPEQLTVRFADGRIERHAPDALAQFVTQAANPGNRRGVSEVVLSLDAPLLARGVELVDTPGTGSVHAQNTDEAMATLRTMDAAVFVLTADPPVSAAEQELLRLVGRASVRTFVVLNKADQLRPEDLREAVGFTRHVVAEVFGDTVPVFVCAARPGARHGVDELATALTGYLTGHRDVDLLRSLTHRTRQLAAGLLDEVLMARAVADLDASRRQQRVAALRAQLNMFGQRRAEATDLVRSQGRHALTEVNTVAQEASPLLTAQVTTAWSTVWEQESGHWPRREREAEGRRRLVEVTRDAVDAWRREQEQQLTDRLAALDQRVRDRLAHDLDTFRDSVADLLGVSLALPRQGGPLVPNPRFRYHFCEDIGQTELLAGWVRRRLPGTAGRERAREHLMAEAASLVPMQVGRVRADFQERLQESTRAMIAAVAARYDKVGHRLSSALQQSEQRPRQDTEHSTVLAERERLLRQMVSDLGVDRGLDGPAPDLSSEGPATGSAP
ncbi:dynamin family protein [Streptomyces sp. NPDC047028]|uniref:dynamin family protein n=1 Tax=Streptomyces sp. NPDC047028 TaxID=3155793 RepID=UPI0033CB94D2